jgi:hypothetical protein
MTQIKNKKQDKKMAVDINIIELGLWYISQTDNIHKNDKTILS